MDDAPPIVGREHELRALRTFAVAIDRPSGLVLEGEPGIGKTTLWSEGVAAAREHGHRVLTSQPAEAERLLSFTGLTDLVGGALEEALGALPPPQRRALEVALLLRDSGGRPPDRRAIATGLYGVIRSLAAADPLVIAIDDVQWLDAASASALGFALRRLGGERVGVLLTVRAGVPEQRSLRLERLPWNESLRRITLRPLSLGALHHLLRLRLGHSFPRRVLQRIHETSGGNPFFAVELAHAVERDRFRPQPGQALPVPGTLTEVVQERLAGLPRRVQRTLRVVAALSNPTIETVEAAFAHENAVTAAIDAAIAAGVLELDGDRLRMTHPLLASAVSSALGPQERRALHRRLAEVVEDPEERARHLALAVAPPSARVADALDDAAERAFLRGAPESAAELAELAATFTPQHRGEDRRRRIRTAAEHHYRTGDLIHSRELLERLLAELPTGGERADVLLAVATTREDDFEAAVELAERALEEAEGEPARLCDINLFLNVVWIIRSDLRRARSYTKTALEYGERAGRPALLAKALAQAALIETWTGAVTPGLLERGVALEETLDRELDFFASPRAVLGRRLMYAGGLEDARRLFEAARDAARRRGDEPSRLAALLNLSELESRAGNWTRAAEQAAEGHEIVEQLGLEQSESGLLYARALADAHLGRVDSARAAAERGIELSRDVKGEIFRLQNLAVLGFLELSRDDGEAADRHLSPLPDILHAAGYRNPGVSPVLPNAIEAAIAVGDLERARRLVNRLAEQADRVDTPWSRAAAARCGGLLAAAEGDYAAAVAALQRALREYERLPMPFERARTLLALGSTQRRAKQKRAAREALGAALALFEELGAVLWSARARGELARVGGRASAGVVLTATERRIAALVAEGHTNREVAAALFVTTKTVEGHLSKIYAKLGVRSRTELAHRLATAERE